MNISQFWLPDWIHVVEMSELKRFFVRFGSGLPIVLGLKQFN